ncbi:MAG TPA: TIGR03118 family protein, partial [Nitrososphaera sp.]|nr:TIGR03118 family protein [Nitrososphaera sp.]
MLKAISPRSVWVGSFLLALVSLPAFAQHFTRTDLTVNLSTVSPTAPNIDGHLVNAWGLSRGTGSPWWISDNGTGVSTLYDLAGVPQIVPPISGTAPLVVTIPATKEGATSTPTGTVFNYTTGFEVAPGKKSIFLFVTEDGTISGWNPGVKPKESVIMVNRAGKAVYKGCTLATTRFGTFHYVVNFKHGNIEVYDSKFQRVHGFDFGFHDERGSRGLVPFNIQNVGGSLIVTFAKKERGSEDEAHGPGLGAVAI